MCGYTVTADPRYTGMNPPLAQRTRAISYRPNGKANDQSLAAGDEMTLAVIDRQLVGAWRS